MLGARSTSRGPFINNWGVSGASGRRQEEEGHTEIPRHTGNVTKTSAGKYDAMANAYAATHGPGTPALHDRPQRPNTHAHKQATGGTLNYMHMSADPQHPNPRGTHSCGTLCPEPCMELTRQVRTAKLEYHT